MNAATLWIPVSLALSAALAAPADPIVAHRARSLQPGEVVMLTIDGPGPLRDVRVRAFDRSFVCFETEDRLKWAALVGIDLDTKPGTYEVRVSARDTADRVVEVQHPLPVEPKRFPTRALAVDPKYVTPPREVLARIQQESERVRAIFDAASSERFWSGPFILPVPGRAISAFGKRSVYNGHPRSPHSGIDFAGAEGTPIRAPNAGRVALAAELYYSGNTVILDHGQGLYSWFGHMSAIAAREGDAVAAGEEVGRIGATGLVTGPHLHWSIRLAGTRVDPLSLIDALEPLK